MLTPGSYAPMVTPLRPDGSVDGDGLRAVVRHIIGGGCSGVLVVGSSGENTAIGVEGRREAIRHARAELSELGTGTLLVGVMQCSVIDARTDIAAAAAAGADAVLVTPPFYGPVAAPAVLRFYRAIAGAADIPLLAYHIPSFTGTGVPVDVVAELAAEGVLAGIKDSGRDLEYLQQVLGAVADVRDFATFTGTDSLILPAMLLGAIGAISVAANIVPDRTSALCSAVIRGDMDTAVKLQQLLTPLALGLRVGEFPAGAKSAVAALGLCAPTMAAPTSGLDAAQQARIDSLLRANQVIPTPPPD